MRFSYAIVALVGAAHAMPAVGSLVTGRSVCNDASANCKSVARAVVADQAALAARQKSRQAKARQANATAAGGDDDDEEEGAGAAAGEGEGETNDKRSKNLFQAEGRAVVTDKAALDARQKSRQAKARQANATAGAGGDDGDDEEEGAGAAAGEGETNDKRSKNLFQTEARAVVADKAALDARQKSRQAKARQANATTAAGGDDDDEEEGAAAAAGEGEGETNDKRSKNLFHVKTRDGNDVRAVTDSAAMDDRMKSREAKSAAANGTADAGAESRKSRKSRKFRKSRRSHQLW